jgi:hypothetical protein
VSEAQERELECFRELQQLERAAAALVQRRAQVQRDLVEAQAAVASGQLPVASRQPEGGGE